MMFGNLFDVFDLTDLNMTFIVLQLSGWLLYLSMVLLLRLFFVCLEKSSVSVIWELKKEVWKNKHLVGIVIFTVIINSSLFHMKLQTAFLYEDVISYLSGIFFFGLFSAGVLWAMPYDEVDFALSQNCNTSIGACCANGAVMAYYEESLNKFRARVQEFEKKQSNITLSVRKLVLIAPLSCNIEGTLSDKDERIRYVDNLEPIERDEGANINRKLTTSVYELYYQSRKVFIAAEFPSPLGTLWGERYGMDDDTKKYIRDCFLEELKKQLESKPVIILEYDDQNPSDTVPLNEFLISSLQKHIEENNFIDNMLHGNAQNYEINETTNKLIH